MNFGPQAGRRYFLPFFQGFCGVLASRASTILTNKMRKYLSESNREQPATQEPIQSSESWQEQSRVRLKF